MGECNPILSAYILYRHLEKYFTHSLIWNKRNLIVISWIFGQLKNKNIYLGFATTNSLGSVTSPSPYTRFISTKHNTYTV